MTSQSSRFNFASAPVSWGVGDFRDAAWDQPYESLLDELAGAGYTGAELGPYGFLPTQADVLERAFGNRHLTLLSSFVPVALGDPHAAASVIEHIRQVGGLLAALKAPYLVLSDAQTPQRQALAGRVPADGSASYKPEQWKNVAKVVEQAERVAGDFGLDLVFHPHVATHVEAPQEVARFFETVAATKTGLCLDTGHCVYGGGDPVREAERYKRLLRYVHIKDIDAAALQNARTNKLDFAHAVAAGVFSEVGKGSIDFPAFFRTLVSVGYSGWMVVEQDVKYGETTVPPARSMAASLEYLKGVVRALN